MLERAGINAWCLCIQDSFISFPTADYMDTYFRLMRAEAFSAIQKGINELKSGKVAFLSFKTD